MDIQGKGEYIPNVTEDLRWGPFFYNENTKILIYVFAFIHVIININNALQILSVVRAQDRSSFSAVHLNHADKGSDECNVIRLLEDDRVAFFTSRDVLEDEELCFDYGKQFWNGRENQKI